MVKRKKTSRTKKKKIAASLEHPSLLTIVDPSLIDVVLDEPTGYDLDAAAQYDNSEALCDVGAREFPSELWIEPREWKTWAAKNDELHLWPEDYRNRFTHQGNSHECTCHALTQVMEIAWNRQCRNKDHAVWFSPLSVYSEANPRRWGGSYMQRTIGICIDRGILPSYNGPQGRHTQEKLFRHTLNETAGHTAEGNGGGSWVSLSRFPDGWRNTARHFKAAEVINPRSFEELCCLLLHGFAVGVGRNGHAIPYVQLVWDQSGNMLAKYSDSYNVHRYDRVQTIRSAVGGAYAVVSTVIPDDWNRPAGVDMLSLAS